MQCVVLSAKGTYRCTSISAEGVPGAKEVAAVLRRATEPAAIGSWKWKSHTLHLWGYKTGKAGTENQHVIPPPLEGTLYGDAVVFATMTEDGVAQVAPLTTAQFMEFQKHKEESDDESEEFEDSESETSSLSEEEEVAESESESEASVILEEEEEEEVAPPPKRTKRVTKKTPQWFAIPPITEADSRSHPLRTQARNQIHAFLQLTAAEEEELERAILEHSLEDAAKRHVHPVWENKEFAILYDIHVRRVISNISKDSYISNIRLAERMKDGEFTVAELASMAFSSLYPEKWKDLFEKEMKREAKMLEVDMSMATDMFRCSKCNKRQCSYYEMQTRSADEPMTIFVRCLNCGKRWRQ